MAAPTEIPKRAIALLEQLQLEFRLAYEPFNR